MFSQFSPVPNDMVGTVIVILVGLLSVGLLIKNLFFNKPLAEQSINRTEFEALRIKVDKVSQECINKEQYNELRSLCATKDAMQTCQKDIEELKHYMHERHHKLANDMNILNLTMEKLHREMDKTISAVKEEMLKELVNVTKSIDKLISVLPQANNKVA